MLIKDLVYGFVLDLKGVGLVNKIGCFRVLKDWVLKPCVVSRSLTKNNFRISCFCTCGHLAVSPRLTTKPDRIGLGSVFLTAISLLPYSCLAAN